MRAAELFRGPFHFAEPPHLDRMPGWAAVLVALAIVAAVAPVIAWLGRSQGRKIKGGFAIALLGIGAIFDPPRRHDLEHHQREEEPSEESGEPKDPEAAG